MAAAPAHDPGVTLNGFHETWPIVYPEDAFGLARTGQTIVGAPDASVIRLFADDEPLDLATGRIRRFERVLDMQIGVLSREVEWESARGRRLLVRSRRLASLDDRHLVAMDYEVVALDGDVRIALCSELVTHAPTEASDDPRVGRGLVERVLEPVAARADAAGTAPRSRCAPAAAGCASRAGSSTSSRPPGPRRSPRRPRATAPASMSSRISAPARRCGCRSSPPTTGRAAPTPATSSRASTARSTGRRTPATTRSSSTTAVTSRSSGAAATWRSRGRPRSSRRCGSTCSSSCRRPLAARASACRRRA